MRGLKTFSEYLKLGVVKKRSPDKSRAKSLILESDRKFKSLNERLKKLGVKDENASQTDHDIQNY